MMKVLRAFCLIFILSFVIGIILLIQMGYVSQFGWDFTPVRFKHPSRQYQVVTARAFELLDSGEDAWRHGDLKTAEARFKTVLNDKSDFPGKSNIDRKARANLVKLYQQKRPLSQKANQ